MSDPEFWARVDAVFNEAVELDGDAGARAALIEAGCNGDAALLAEVRSLLTAHEHAGGFLAEGADGSRGGGVGIGTTVGVYRLVARIGEGGMGDVYRAERADGLFGHAVALKVTRGTVVDPAAASRFATERQILATLQHPHIVTLLDGGTLVDGRAYLVMELVDGAPITKYCTDRTLSLEARLSLFRQVCAAAHYAHRHAIVHRDLKPANVLVTPDGVVKVLDFGVAKLLAAEAADGQTVPGVLPGPLTPNYASPEQLRGLPVTTASDVYALGVLLYELVTGGRPYETTGQPLDRVIDLVVRTEPPRPSSAPPKAGEPLPWDRRRLRGDLDAIALKALAKAPEARYASAEQLADDVARFVAGQPVTAREPSAWYLLRKLASRHRVAVAAGGLALAGILAASGVALWQRQVAERQRQRAEARFEDVRTLANTVIFKVYEDIKPLPGSTPVRKAIIEDTLKYLERLQQDTDTDLKLRYELAGAYQRIALVLGDPQTDNLGDRAGALAVLQRAERLIASQAQHPDAPIDTVGRFINIQRQLVGLYGVLGQPDERTRASEKALRLAEQLHARHPQTRQAQELLGHALFEQALSIRNQQASIPVWERARGIYEALLASRPGNFSDMRNIALVEKYLAARLGDLQSEAAAAPHYQRALDLDERRLAAEPANRGAQFDVAIDLASVALAHEERKDYAPALTLRRRSVAMRRGLVAADPKNEFYQTSLGRALAHLGRVESLAGQQDLAIAHAVEGVAIVRASARTTNDTGGGFSLALALEALAFVYDQGHQPARACEAYREAVDSFIQADPTGNTAQRKSAVAGLAACTAR